MSEWSPKSPSREGPATITVSAPGKVLLFGEHAVVYGKLAIASTVNLRTTATFERGAEMPASKEVDPRVEVHLPDVGITCGWSTEEIGEVVERMQIEFVPIGAVPVDALDERVMKACDILVARYRDSSSRHTISLVSFLYLFIMLCRRKSALRSTGSLVYIPLNASFKSALPTGAGLGSSASYSVCLSAGLLAANQHIPCRGNTDKYLDLINHWAFLCEKIIHGNPSGVDNTVVTYGGALSYHSGGGSMFSPIHNMPRIRLLLVNTKVGRNTKQLVAGVRRRRDEFPSIVCPMLDAIHGCSLQCVELLQSASEGEIERVDLERKMGTVMVMNHMLLNAIGVGHAQLDVVMDISQRWMASGVVAGAKLTGAGGGGCAIILVPSTVSHSDIDAVIIDLEEAGFEVIQTSIGDVGVVFESS